MKINHTMIEDKFNAFFAESAGFRMACELAQAHANNTKKPARLYKVYGQYGTQTPARDYFEGNHITFINPQS